MITKAMRNIRSFYSMMILLIAISIFFYNITFSDGNTIVPVYLVYFTL